MKPRTIKQDTKELLSAYGLRPKKSLGQNFLIDAKVYQDIIRATDTKRGDTFLEIGAGIGTLTEYLLNQAGETGEIVAVEKDKKLVPILKDRFAVNDNVKIIEEDILEFSTKSYKLKVANYKVVGNIPYYLTSRLLRTIFDKWPQPENIVLLIQKEVAQRIMAQPPNGNLLGISVQYFAEPEIIRHVGKNSFWPAPNVTSSVIKLTPKQKKEDNKFNELFFKVLRAGFSTKRKQILNALNNQLDLLREDIETLLKESKINPTRRAETLTLDEWKNLAKNFRKIH